MAPRRIRVEVFGNLAIRDYHITERISNEKVSGGILGGDRLNPFNDVFSDKEHSPETRATVLRFYDIDGIKSVGLDVNSVRIEISSAYEWEEIHDDIVKTLKVVAGWQEEDVDLDYLFCGQVYADGVSRGVHQAEVNRQRIESARYDRMFG